LAEKLVSHLAPFIALAFVWMGEIVLLVQQFQMECEGKVAQMALAN
jgi:hypothetical protein